MLIYCCECKVYVDTRLTNGNEIYSHRKDLANIPFWKCDTCGNYVGCHHKTNEKTKPLGVIPDRKIRELRKEIHSSMDFLWKDKKISRRALYRRLTNSLGFEFHTAELKTEKDCKLVLECVSRIRSELCNH